MSKWFRCHCRGLCVRVETVGVWGGQVTSERVSGPAAERHVVSMSTRIPAVDKCSQSVKFDIIAIFLFFYSAL